MIQRQQESEHRCGRVHDHCCLDNTTLQARGLQAEDAELYLMGAVAQVSDSTEPSSAPVPGRGLRAHAVEANTSEADSDDEALSRVGF